MRIFEINGHNSSIRANDLANLFDVRYIESRDGTVDLMYDLTRGIIFTGMDSQTKPLTYKVAVGDTWMGISYGLYEDTRYWWILAKLNGCDDATVEPEAGSTIYVLEKGNLDAVCKGIRT